MGPPTYNIAGFVHLVMAQCLVRKLCIHCNKPGKIPDPSLLEAGFQAEELTGWRPMTATGCEKCNNTGYKRAP